MTPDLDEVVEQVRRIREQLCDREMFQGYSGFARMASGLAALAGMLILASGRVPADPWAHLAVWAGVLALSLVFNYGALAHWYVRSPAARRGLLALKPAVDAIPVLAAGAFLSLASVRAEAFDVLFGVWMCLFGLVHVASRHTLPRANYALGLAYIGAGAVCLLSPSIRFLNPWPMGVTFFIGESLGGWILVRHATARRKEQSHDD
jgi:hypothetical protein